MELKSGSNLEKILRAGHFAFTGELGPPRGTSAAAVREKAKHLKGMVDSVNITDNQTAMVRMSSWGASLILLEEGLEPNYQMVCRDRNRLAMQSGRVGGLCPGHPQHALSVGGSPAVRRSSAGQERLRHRLHPAHPDGLGHARNRQVPRRCGYRGSAADVHRRGGQPLRRSLRVARHRLAKKVAAGPTSFRPSAFTIWTSSAAGSPRPTTWGSPRRSVSWLASPP